VRWNIEGISLSFQEFMAFFGRPVPHPDDRPWHADFAEVE
jgi:hypothetical protein